MPAKTTGAKQLNATLAKAAKDITNMPPAVHQQAGRALSDSIASYAPRRTGRLASSFQARAIGGGALVSSSVPYGGFVNYGTRRRRGQHFVQRGLDAATDQVAEIYLAECDRALGNVKGA